MNYEYYFHQKRSISDEEWKLITENIITAFDLCKGSALSQPPSIYKVGHGHEDEPLQYWTSLFFPNNSPGHTRGIDGWDIEGECIAFGSGSRESYDKDPKGADISNSYPLPLILPQDVQLLPQPWHIYTAGQPYDLLVRYTILIFHNFARDAYHFSLNEEEYTHEEAEKYWFQAAEELSDKLGWNLRVPFNFIHLTGHEDFQKPEVNKATIAIECWKQSLRGLSDQYF